MEVRTCPPYQQENDEAEAAAELTEHAYLEVVRHSRLSPREHFDALLGAIMSAHPEASVQEIAGWLAYPLSKSAPRGDATGASGDR